MIFVISAESDLITTTATTVTLIVVLLLYLNWKSKYWEKRKVKSFPTNIIFGNLEFPFTSSKSTAVQFENLYKRARKERQYYFGLYSILQSPVFMPVNLEYVKFILTKDFHYFYDRGLYYNEEDDPISAHLFAIGGKEWRNLRGKITPTFTASKIRKMFQTIADCGQLLEDVLHLKATNHEPIDTKEIFGRYATDIICSCAFGLHVHASLDPDSEFRRYGKRVFHFNPFRRIQQQFCMNFPNLARFIHLRSIPKSVSDFFTKVVQDTVAYRKKTHFVRNDFLQLMIEMQEKDDSVTLDMITAQCFAFFVAGFESPSTAMSFALFELAVNPDIQDKVREEIRTVLKKYNNEVTYESMKELKYMDQVIDETLRKWPTFAVLTRRCVNEYKLPYEDITIEKGTRVFIPVVGIHHDEQYYPNPNKFDPDRFTEENRRKIPDYAYIPFGEGPRLCVGIKFGVMQMKVGLTSILKNYRVTLSNKTKVPIVLSKSSVILSAEGGIWLNLEKL